MLRVASFQQPSEGGLCLHHFLPVIQMKNPKHPNAAFSFKSAVLLQSQIVSLLFERIFKMKSETMLREIAASLLVGCHCVFCSRRLPVSDIDLANVPHDFRPDTCMTVDEPYCMQVRWAVHVLRSVSSPWNQEGNLFLEICT